MDFDVQSATMPAQISGLNTLWVIRYLRQHHPDIDLAAMMAEINRGGPFLLHNLQTGALEPVSLQHLADARYWFSNRFMMVFYKAIETRIPEPRPGYTIGRLAHLAHPIRRAAIIAPLIGTQHLLKTIVRESRKFNRTKDTYLLHSSRVRTVIRLVHHEGIQMVDFGMDWHAGVFHAYAVLAGATEIDVQWQKRDAHFKVVDFELHHRYPAFWQRMYRALVFNIPAVRNAITKAEEIQEEHRRTILNQERIIQSRTERIEAMQQQLLARERMMTEGFIAGGMAHEIRNTLGAAQLRLRQVERLTQDVGDENPMGQLLDCFRCAYGLSLDERKVAVQTLRGLYETRRGVRGSLKSIDQAVQRGLNVADRLMDYAMLQQSGIRTICDPGKIVRELVDIYGTTWGRQGIAFQLDIADGVFVPAQPGQIHSVLQNLMLNARDAIHATGRGRGEIRIRVARQGSEALIEVGDDGVGIAQEDCEKVFQPFYSTKPHAGMGLGLSACRKMVVACGGRIAAMGANGQGALLRVVLPIRAAKTENSDTAAPPATNEPPFTPLV
ncbi:sensor histidine kinase [Desulfatitalea alkaliphila]|uniref:histidine kinase n=1 Tax=Desulfatitalea alkaliphila TaxID=2929485 RepID=A0AA41R3P8_9BACT|nr:HAMP domain-containing sensor histidine kinase [Desulfatitalea alkaliphila]MCJ8500216.1 HAMP domain-containing histidine kinase [Desulfatitalea alkaliphila]